MHPFYKRLFQQNEHVMKFGLEAIQKALSLEPKIVSYPHILIAGTNGKGQTSALFANALTMGGIRTGLFTSPHLVDFRERIRVDGRMLSEEEIIRIGEQVLCKYGGDDIPEFSGVALTYFECCLMMALRAFQARNVEFGVFEVGLGGRLDATNALNPQMSIITSISRDHEEYLGHDTASIACEKAGIMRSGCPVVCGRNEVDTLEAEARARGCSSFDALGRDFEWHESAGALYLDSRFGKIELPGGCRLVSYQRDNAAVAIFALLKAKETGLISIPVRDILNSLICKTKWVGRMWPCSPETAQKCGVAGIILDGAHNPDGVRAFVEAAKRTPSPHALVVNSCSDKDIEQMFPQYLETFPPDSIFVVPVESTKRACSPADYCSRTHLDISQACSSLREGLERAAKAIGPRGIIYISGSLYLIGEAIRELHEEASLESIL